jgi:hypothetical protein
MRAVLRPFAMFITKEELTQAYEQDKALWTKEMKELRYQTILDFSSQDLPWGRRRLHDQSQTEDIGVFSF